MLFDETMWRDDIEIDAYWYQFCKFSIYLCIGRFLGSDMWQTRTRCLLMLPRSIPGFFLSTFSAKSNLWKAGNLSFWIFILSFYKSLFSKSELFWLNLTWVLQKMGWFSSKIAKTWVFFPTWVFRKVVKKKAWLST